ncbi:MAG: DUF134 domain-containing protein [Planctomycetota bacterium]
MVRPKCCRIVGVPPGVTYFKPRAIPLSSLEEVVLPIDEFEALRLADLEGLYQEEAATKMKISRQTFGRIIEIARKKVADALANGKALRIEGGTVKISAKRKFKCSDCSHTWEFPYGEGRPDNCPSCKSNDIHRVGKSGSCGQKGGCSRSNWGCTMG